MSKRNRKTTPLGALGTALLGGSLLVGGPVAAEDAARSGEVAKPKDGKSVAAAADKPQKKARARMPIYKPPAVGKPTRTVGGGSRGTSNTVPVVLALVPEHVAQSAAPSPSLFWYVDRVPDASWKVLFTLNDVDEDEPLVDEAVLPNPTRPGIYRIRLSEFEGVSLEPGHEYDWSVAIVIDSGDRAKDVVATGWIEGVERSSTLESRLRSEGSDRTVHVYADEGLWYDALTEIDDRLQASPDDAELSAMRANLLDQVGIDSSVSGG